MKSSSQTRSSISFVILIISLLGLVLTGIFLNRRSINDIQHASASIYKDRLVPTGLLVNLTATVYRKRLLLETFVLATPKPEKDQMVSSLDRLNRRTDSLLVEFEQTTLTVREADQLRILKQRLAVYNQLEGELATNLTDPIRVQQTLFGNTGNTAFGQVAHTLDELVSLQLTVGKQLLSESSGQTNYIYVLTALQIGLVLTIGLIIFWQRF